MHSRSISSNQDAVEEDQLTAEVGWSSNFVQYLPTSSTLPNAPKSHYPFKENRYFGGSLRYQHCYTDADLKLLQNVVTKYKDFPEQDQKIKYFDMSKDESWYGLLTCSHPSREYGLQHSYTLPKRKVRDSSSFPLRKFSENMAAHIGNWQEERARNQNQLLMNDPYMLVLDEFKDWFYFTLADQECDVEVFKTLSERQGYIRYVTHITQDFGDDRTHLNDVYRKLFEANQILFECVANKQLPDLLKDVCTKGEDLEKTLGPYLHFYVNEPVTPNFATDFFEAKPENCHLSPICKIFANANKETPTEIATGLKTYVDVNRLYRFQNDSNGHITMSPKENLLDNVNFASFVTPEIKQVYVDTLTAIESMMSVRKTFDRIKTIQASMGTLNFALYYSNEMSAITERYKALAGRAQRLTEQLVDAADLGFENNLKYPNKNDIYFQENLFTWDNLVTTTTKEQLESDSTKVLESMTKYIDGLKKLEGEWHTREASKKMQEELLSLSHEINCENSILIAQLEGRNLLIPTELKQSLAIESTSKDSIHHEAVNKTIEEQHKTEDHTFTKKEYAADKTNVCTIPNLTSLDKLKDAALGGATHGFFRGGSKIVGSFFPQKVSRGVSESIYYAFVYVMNFNHICQQLERESGHIDFIHAGTLAAIETGKLGLFNASLSLSSWILTKLGKKLEEHALPISAKVAKAFGSVIPFSVFAYSAVETSVPEAATAMLTGSAVQVATETFGKSMLGRQ